MSDDNKTAASTTPSTLAMMGHAAKEAGKMIAAKGSNDILGAAIKRVLIKAGIQEEVLTNEVVDVFIKLAAPMVFNLVATTFSEQIDGMIGKGKSDAIARVSAAALEAALFEVGGKVMDLVGEMVVPLLKEAAKGGDAAVGSLGLAGDEPARSRVREV